jgi:hypothetical protein
MTRNVLKCRKRSVLYIIGGSVQLFTVIWCFPLIAQLMVPTGPMLTVMKSSSIQEPLFWQLGNNQVFPIDMVGMPPL